MMMMMMMFMTRPLAEYSDFTGFNNSPNQVIFINRYHAKLRLLKHHLKHYLDNAIQFFYL